MTRPFTAKSRNPEHLHSLTHASGWVQTPQESPQSGTHWVELFNLNGNPARIVREGQPDLIFENGGNELRMKRGETVEARQRTVASRTNIVLPESGKVLLVSIGYYGGIEELQNLAADHGTALWVSNDGGR